MMKKNMIQARLAVIFSIALLLLGSLATKKASAEEIVVTGNGADSTNQVQQTSADNTTVQSSNTTTVDNSVTVDANTGGNSTSASTGGNTEIKTGDVNTTTQIANSGNVSTVTAPSQSCCSQSGTLTIISGNGAGSQNTISNQTSNTTTIAVNQSANITNNILVNANTGGNTANYNTGNVTIQTGSITVKQSLRNAPINLTWITAALAQEGKNKLAITGNGAGSENTISNYQNNNLTIDVTNVANIFNNSLLNVNTGDNEADDNIGNVDLGTGDILIETEISNAANAVKVDVSCGCKEKPQEQPAPVTPVQKVTPPTPNESSSSSGGSSHGEVAGIALEKALPTTGTNWLFLAFIGNVMMLFLGMILRLRSGNSPGIVAIA